MEWLQHLASLMWLLQPIKGTKDLTSIPLKYSISLSCSRYFFLAHLPPWFHWKLVSNLQNLSNKPWILFKAVYNQVSFIFPDIVFSLLKWFLLYVHEYFAFMYVCAPRTCLLPVGYRRGCCVPGIGVKVGCESPCGRWESNRLSLQER